MEMEIEKEGQSSGVHPSPLLLAADSPSPTAGLDVLPLQSDDLSPALGCESPAEPNTSSSTASLGGTESTLMSESESELRVLSEISSPSFTDHLLDEHPSAAFVPPPPTPIRVAGSSTAYRISFRDDLASLVFSPTGGTRSRATRALRFSDLLNVTAPGGSPVATPSHGASRRYPLVLHSFPVLKPSFGGSAEQPKRRHEPIHISFATEAQQQAWRAAIKAALAPARRPTGSGDPEKPLLVFVNPFGGTKQAPEILKRIGAVLRVAELPFHVKQTEYAGHALEFAQNQLELDRWSGLVTISGDGLLWEVINGLMRRSDWRRALDVLPLGIIPGGSGNGLATSLRNLDPITAAFCIAKGWERPMDLIRVNQDGQALWSFLSINWAMISDIDFESETFRWMGGARFTVTAVARVLNLRSYRGRILLKPALAYPCPILTPKAASWFESKRAPVVSEEPALCGPGCSTCLRPEQRIQLDIPSLSSDLPSELSSSTPSLSSSLSFPTEDGEIGNLDDWVTLDGKFILFCAANVTHIGFDAKIAPYGHLSDGAMDVVVIRKGASKPALAEFLVALEEGTHLVGSEIHEYYKASALVLEPEGGMIGIDGERTPNTPIACNVLHGAIRLLGAHP